MALDPKAYTRHALTHTNGVRWCVDSSHVLPMAQCSHDIDLQRSTTRVAVLTSQAPLESSESLIAPLFNLHLVWEHSETRVQLRPRETLLRALLQVNAVPPLDASQLLG